MTTADLDRIEALASKATPELACDDHIVRKGDTPGQWHLFDATEDDPPLATFDFVNAENDAKFHAAADPETVLELCRLARRGMEQKKP